MGSIPHFELIKMPTRIKVKFGLLFGLVVLIAVSTPHLLHGHVIVPEEYAQSIVLFLNLAMAAVFYHLYKKDLEKIAKEKEKTEEQLIDSYKYIGKTNVTMEIYNRFINLLPTRSRRIKEKDIFMVLLQNLLISVLKTDKGFLRFINSENTKTVKEISFNRKNEHYRVKLSNIEIIKNRVEDHYADQGIAVIRSDYENTRIICTLCYWDNSSEEVDARLVKTLLNQIHLLFLAIHSDHLLGKGNEHRGQKSQRLQPWQE